PASIRSDIKRLQQILKNLLSNAFKFTHRGHVTLSIEEVFGGWTVDNESLNRAQDVIAFSVADTGIGISVDKQQIIFEAF
ncbi:ATP-binding protein, partial [Paraburkholderia sp. SIMBA_050]